MLNKQQRLTSKTVTLDSFQKYPIANWIWNFFKTVCCTLHFSTSIFYFIVLFKPGCQQPVWLVLKGEEEGGMWACKSTRGTRGGGKLGSRSPCAPKFSLTPPPFQHLPSRLRCQAFTFCKKFKNSMKTHLR